MIKRIGLWGSIASIFALVITLLSTGTVPSGTTVENPSAGSDQTIINVRDNPGNISVDNREVVITINIDGNMLPVRKSDFATAATISRDVEPLTEAPSQPLSSCASVRSLAQEFGLLSEAPPNIHLMFDDGDIGFFCKQAWSERKYKLEFAARRVVLDAARESKLIIKDKGTLSWAAQEVMSEMLRATQ